MLKVLLVDDEKTFRSLARSMVEEEGDFRVIAEASDGSEAVALTARLGPDLVLMDVQMNPMNGFEAARHILDRYPGTRIVLISMNQGKEYSRLGKEVGVVAFIPKRELSLSTLRQVCGISA